MRRVSSSVSCQNKIKMNKLYRTIPLLLIFAIIGCNQSPNITTITSTTEISLMESSTSIPSPTIQPYSTITPTPEVSNNRIAAPPGLIFRSEDGIWAIKSDGSSMYLAPNRMAYFSPNNQYLLFNGIEDHYVLDLTTGKIITELNRWDSKNDPDMLYAEIIHGAIWSSDSKYIYYYSSPNNVFNTDIWSIDILTGTKKNLSNTENRREGKPGLFSNDSVLVFSSIHIEDPYPRSSGYLTSMAIDGSNYIVHSEDNDKGSIRISPDGKTAAIFGGELFTSDNLLTKITPTTNDEDHDLDYQLYYPRWSSDSKYIGWGVGIDTEEIWLNGIGIYNTEDNTLNFLYPYIMVDGEGFPRAPDWSPDNNWVTFNALNPDSRNGGLYLVKADNSEEYFFEGFENAVWDPESKLIILNTGYFDGAIYGRGVWVTNLNDWNMAEIDLPDDAIVIDWIDPEKIQTWVGFDS